MHPHVGAKPRWPADAKVRHIRHAAQAPHLDGIANAERGPDVWLTAILRGHLRPMQHRFDVVADLNKYTVVLHPLDAALYLLADSWELDVFPLCTHESRDAHQTAQRDPSCPCSLCRMQWACRLDS